MINCEKWQCVNNDAPGYYGKNRDQKRRQYDELYGKGNWQIVWVHPMKFFSAPYAEFEEVCKLYEDAYFHYLSFRPDLVELLVQTACDVYDDEVENTKSGLDYTIQTGPMTHIQDIAVRNCIKRLGRKFEGKELVQVRSRQGTHWFGYLFSPGNVPFHRLDLVVRPQNHDEIEQKRWWKPGSVEDFYQMNKRIIVKKP